ncbi:MAG: hypothetical protein QG576_403 [Bacteroidota bacterium]|nr:hypothetical protein [Bacteroidota bacterium]
MKKYILSCSIIIILLSVLQLNAQDLKKNTIITGVCYAGNKVNRIYIPPPARYLKNPDTKGGATIKIIYNEGFTTMRKPPVEKAVGILKSLLPPDVNITVLAEWTTITTTGVLASSSATGYSFGSVINAFKPSAIYPVSLAEKIAGKNLNGNEEADIQLKINRSINWYLGTDGNPIPRSYDLVTVILHELIHGLGFFDSMNSIDTLGSYGVDSIPLIYDTFIEDLAGKKLTDTLIYKNPSTNLNSQLTGGKLYFNGPLTYYYSGKRTKLWAPSKYDAGSSISHLDDDSTSLENGLMTPFIDLQEAIHDPGKLTMSILGDIGWINTRIIHVPHGDTEENLTEIPVKAVIESDTTFDSNNVGLVRSFDEFVTSDTVYLAKTAGDTFMTTVPIPGYNSGLEYYLFVKDCFSRIYRLPSLIDTVKFSVYVGKDTVKPVISHTPIGYYFEKIDSVRLFAKATDNIGIDSVYVEYVLNENVPAFIGLIHDSADVYKNEFSAKTLSLEGGDSLRYRIIAIDKANESNRSYLPKVGYFKVPIENIEPVAKSYSTDFTNANEDFFSLGFDIVQPAGFAGKALHTIHPYKSPEKDGDSIVYTSLLRTPVKFDTTGMLISYKELVLVEPGEDGAPYGSQDFYDYVVVEGSRDFGNSWFPVADGYDSRLIASWLTAYNSSIVDNNSTYVGKESMMLKHSVNLMESSEISPGDTLLIRFRLYSDPYAYGWGWVIDDLHIGPIVDAVEDIIYNQFVIYPNPGNGQIFIRNLNGSGGKPVRYSILNAAGNSIMTGLTTGTDTDFINISGNPPGIYFIVLNGDNGIKAIKYNLVR